MEGFVTMLARRREHQPNGRVARQTYSQVSVRLIRRHLRRPDLVDALRAARQEGQPVCAIGTVFSLI